MMLIIDDDVFRGKAERIFCADAADIARGQQRHLVQRSKDRRPSLGSNPLIPVENLQTYQERSQNAQLGLANSEKGS